MCTVSVVPLSDGFRLTCNRDELRTRPRALPPSPRRVGSRTAVYPVDVASGGTWVGVNDAGLALAVLNGPHDATLRGPRYSRGIIIPGLLGAEALSDAIALASRLDVRLFPAFRLVVAQRQWLVVVSGDGRRLTVERSRLDAPRAFTCSSLDSARVEAQRLHLFRHMVVSAGAGDRLHAQTRFHAHSWTDRREASVTMVRADASTVSRSVVDVRGTSICLEYCPLELMREAA